MNTVDSSAWLAYMAGERNAVVFAPALEDTANLLVPSITITEVFKRVLRDVSEHDALLVAAQMRLGTVVDLDERLAMEAATLGLMHNLPLADSIIYATSRAYSAVLWTQDRGFEGLPGVKYHRKQ